MGTIVHTISSAGSASSPYRNLSLGTTGVSVKGSQGLVFGWQIYNNAAAARFVKFYDKATAPAVGTDTPIITIGIAATPGRSEVTLPAGIPFALGIGIGASNLIADNDTTAPTANDVVVNLFYK